MVQKAIAKKRTRASIDFCSFLHSHSDSRLTINAECVINSHSDLSIQHQTPNTKLVEFLIDAHKIEKHPQPFELIEHIEPFEHQKHHKPHKHLKPSYFAKSFS
jgi:hypothetical protein